MARYLDFSDLENIEEKPKENFAQAKKYFEKGLREDDPLGFDDYKKLENITGLAAPVIQQLAKSSDAALRSFIALLYGGAGAVGDISGDKLLGRELAAMIENFGGTLGMGLGSLRPIPKAASTSSTIPEGAIKVYRGERFPYKIKSENRTGVKRGGDYYTPSLEMAKMYALSPGTGYRAGIPVIRSGYASPAEVMQGISKHTAGFEKKVNPQQAYDRIVKDLDTMRKTDVYGPTNFMLMDKSFKKPISVADTFKALISRPIQRLFNL